jgi:hypothetical protein
MSIQYSLDGDTWTPISSAGEDISAWLDEQNDGLSGTSDVRLWSGESEPGEDEITEAKRVYRPSSNDGILISYAASALTIHYARCASSGDTATISVNNNIKPKNTRLERLEESGDLYFLSTLLEDQSDDLVALWRVGENPLNFTTGKTSTLKTTYTLIEAPTVTADGTQGSVFNRNRNYPDDGLEFTRFTGASYSGGTTLSVTQTGASSSPGQSSSSPAVELAGTLKANTDYILIVSPSASNDITLDILWWEK